MHEIHMVGHMVVKLTILTVFDTRHIHQNLLKFRRSPFWNSLKRLKSYKADALMKMFIQNSQQVN